MILGPGGAVLQRPADSPCLLHLAMGAALCNDSALVYRPDKGAGLGRVCVWGGGGRCVCVWVRVGVYRPNKGADLCVGGGGGGGCKDVWKSGTGCT